MVRCHAFPWKYCWLLHRCKPDQPNDGANPVSSNVPSARPPHFDTDSLARSRYPRPHSRSTRRQKIHGEVTASRVHQSVARTESHPATSDAPIGVVATTSATPRSGGSGSAAIAPEAGPGPRLNRSDSPARRWDSTPHQFDHVLLRDRRAPGRVPAEIQVDTRRIFDSGKAGTWVSDHYGLCVDFNWQEDPQQHRHAPPQHPAPDDQITPWARSPEMSALE